MTLPTSGLVAAAERLLNPPPGTAEALAPGTRARAAAALLRLALDETMNGYWRRISPGMTRSKGRTKMLCLAYYAGPQVARRWYAVWAALSSACHHHSYELPPTPAEIRARVPDVAELIRSLPDPPAGDGQERPGGRPGRSAGRSVSGPR
ncbi:hypothetical protein [Streptomyces sp. 7-21]|uniref:hypothetical protein n=1 Tax=Streptomyces sp. 7-21 TaxID=2802283 RepID=UPI00191F3368|nr:hypothetical protein [Streptomyces sp. 7-21]MBL1067449.1 hypothetical protein [Streptomyces sp. 7-21]